MSEFEKENLDCIRIQKNHGPGGELPTVSIGTKKETAKKSQPVDASWEPVRPKPNELERIKACATNAFPLFVMSAVIFYWQQSGQLDQTTGFYTLIVLALLGGLTIGRCMVR